MKTPTVLVPTSEPSNCELRQLCVEGFARRYALRARVEGKEVIIEGVEQPRRLPSFRGEVSTGLRPASGLVPAPKAAAALRVVVERLQLELKAIEQAGLADYFLFVAECARYGRGIGATCFARGASPGSLVTYLLEVSTVDPIRHGLLFERFWNPKRAHLPAIYLEFADDRLAGVIEHVRRTCSRNPVAQLVTDLESNLAADLPTLGLLGLKALTVLRRACERVRQATGIEVPIDQLPLDDAKTYDLLSRGDTTGIFPLEDEELRDLCRKFQPTSVAHICALISAHAVAPSWPGPAGFIPDFLALRHRRASIKHTHKTLEPITRETYGVLLYQEQMMQAAQAVAGYTLSDANQLRRAIALRRDEELAQHRKLFEQGAKERNGISESKANEIFDWLEMFSRFGFNKSHPAAYAMLAYQTAYLKAHYPGEFNDAISAKEQTWRSGFAE